MGGGGLGGRRGGAARDGEGGEAVVDGMRVMVLLAGGELQLEGGLLI